jgi:hypothetical protein
VKSATAAGFQEEGGAPGARDTETVGGWQASQIHRPVGRLVLDDVARGRTPGQAGNLVEAALVEAALVKAALVKAYAKQLEECVLSLSPHHGVDAGVLLQNAPGVRTRGGAPEDDESVWGENAQPCRQVEEGVDVPAVAG